VLAKGFRLNQMATGSKIGNPSGGY